MEVGISGFRAKKLCEKLKQRGTFHRIRVGNDLSVVVNKLLNEMMVK